MDIALGLVQGYLNWYTEQRELENKID
jgi:hypothetical protein